MGQTDLCTDLEGDYGYEGVVVRGCSLGAEECVL